MMKTSIRDLSHFMNSSEPLPAEEWQLRAIQSDQCMSFVAWNTQSKEALLIDPKDTDLQAYLKLSEELSGYRWIAVIDTHTHADHISVASKMSATLNAPLLMHAQSPTLGISKVARSDLFTLRARLVTYGTLFPCF